MEFVDIAGLVEGASKGEGLGNKFLSHIRETDAIAQVVRCFENDDIMHVNGKVDPLADIETINTELALADLDTVERAIQRVTKNTRSGNKDAIAQKALFERLYEHLGEGLPARSFDLEDDERLLMKELHLITIKPLLFIANVSDDGFENNPLLDAVSKQAETEGAELVVVCASLEEELSQLEDEDQAEFLEDLGLCST